MAEFQRKKMHEDLLSALGNMGLRVGPELEPPAHPGSALGPGATAPVAIGDIAGLAPDSVTPAPAEAVPTLPLDPPPSND